MNVNHLQGYLIPLGSNSATEGFVKTIAAATWNALKAFAKQISLLLEKLIRLLRGRRKEVHDGYRIVPGNGTANDGMSDRQASDVIQRSIEIAKTPRLIPLEEGSPSKIQCVNDFIAIPQRLQYLETIHQELSKEMAKIQWIAQKNRSHSNRRWGETDKKPASIIRSNLQSLQYSISFDQFQSYPLVFIEKAEAEKQLAYYESEINSLKHSVESMSRIMDSIQANCAEEDQSRLNEVRGWCQALFSEIVKTVPFIELFARSISIRSKSILT